MWVVVGRDKRRDLSLQKKHLPKINLRVKRVKNRIGKRKISPPPLTTFVNILIDMGKKNFCIAYFIMLYRWLFRKLILSNISSSPVHFF